MDYVINKCECTINQGNLSIAATYGNYKFVELALTKYKKSLIPYSKERYGDSTTYHPLINALSSKQIKICQLLIQHNYCSLNHLHKDTVLYNYQKYQKFGWKECTKFLE